MKKIFITSLITLLVLVFSPTPAKAVWNYYNHSEPYTVQSGTAPVITVDLSASPSSLTPPANQTTLSWTTTGTPDSCTATTLGSWTGSKTPSGGSELVGGLTVGNYLFEITCIKAGAANATDTALVVISNSSGTLTADDCTIASGGASCSSSVAWTTANLGAGATSITRDMGSPASFTPSPLAAGSQGITLSYGTTTFSLIHGGSTLATDPATASCTSGTSWDGNSCEVGGGGPVNGMCGASHWSCIQGTSANQVTGGSSWTWDCLGSGGGSNDSCEEPFGGSYECSDGADNDGDGLKDYPNDPGCTGPTDNSELDGAGAECSDGIDNTDTEDTLADDADPGCHSDGNAGNPASYDPNDTDERNKRKPIFIEF